MPGVGQKQNLLLIQQIQKYKILNLPGTRKLKTHDTVKRRSFINMFCGCVKLSQITCVPTATVTHTRSFFEQTANERSGRNITES